MANFWCYDTMIIIEIRQYKNAAQVDETKLIHQWLLEAGNL